MLKSPLTPRHAYFAISRAIRDREWRHVLSGAMDFRLKVQILPRLFTGPSSVRLPARWHLLSRRLATGFETSFIDADTRAAAYRDVLTLLPAD